MAKDSFIFYRSFYEASKSLKDKDRVKLYDAICEKSLNDEEIKLTGLADSMFKLIKPQLEANMKKYENGKKGGRPKKQNETSGFENKKTKENQNETLGFENNIKNKNQNETETKANVNVECRMNNVNENAECKIIMKCYEENIGTVTPASAELILSYLDNATAEMIVQAIKIATQRNKRSAKYIQGILNDWIRKGYKTLADIENEKKEVKSNLEEVWSE